MSLEAVSRCHHTVFLDVCRSFTLWIPGTGSLGSDCVTTEMKMHDRKPWLCLEASALHT